MKALSLSACKHGDGKAMDMGSICEAADVFTVQTQTHLLANHLWAHAFGSVQKRYLDQASEDSNLVSFSTISC